MSEKSRGIDTYATRHCPVVVFEGDELKWSFDSISDCAKAFDITAAKVKHFLYYQELFGGRLDFDIPADSIYEAKIEAVVRKRGLKNVVRIIRRDRQKKAVKRFERTYIGGRMNIKPLDTNILIEKVQEKKTASGLILIENDNYSGLTIGNVKAIGDSVNTVSVGQKVLYQDSDSTEITVDGEKLYIIDQGNLFAIVE